MKIKAGDHVHVISGKDKGKEGVITQVFPKLGRVVVDGVNQMTRHLKARGNTPGQKISYCSPINISNVQIVSEKTGLRGRIGYKTIEKDGRIEKVREIRSHGKKEDIE